MFFILQGHFFYLLNELDVYAFGLSSNHIFNSFSIIQVDHLSETLPPKLCSFFSLSTIVQFRGGFY